MSENLHVGTSGWSYKDWVGPFYPEGTAAKDYLGLYAGRFPAVEIDSTYYGIPRISTVEGWAERTPEAFRFTVKVPREVTHGADGERPRLDHVLRDEAGVLPRFLETLAPLGEKLAVVLFQFPYFRVKEMQAGDFLDRLDAALERFPRELRAAVEIRNKGWIGEDYVGRLRRHRAAGVLIDHPYMPAPLAQLRQLGATSDFAYVRLLGDRHGIEKLTKTWGATVENKSARIREWAEVLRALLDRDEVNEAYAFSNNHFAGHGPATARELADAVGDCPF